MFSKQFICASAIYNTYEKHVPSPYFKKIFSVNAPLVSAAVTICGLGFYDIFINGHKITKGLLAPYISNPDHFIYYDGYDLLPYLVVGENVLVVQLGNGMQNAQGGIIWDFDIAPFRDVPKLAFALELQEEGKPLRIIEADETVQTKPSPICFDDLRSGVFYDANLETADLHAPVFGAGWKNSMPASAPAGEPSLCSAEPIVPARELKPALIRKARLAGYKTPFWEVSEYIRLNDTKTEYTPQNKEGYLYDFGENTAGIVRLNIHGKKGQKIELQFCEYIDEAGNPSYANIYFYPDGYAQRDIYICKGEMNEVFQPQFTYHGFRYCMVMGITEEQAVPELLTAVVCHSDVKQRARFLCSDTVANTLYTTALRSDLANFYYFPTDCPHREKNGWTGDAAVSAEQFMLNFQVENSLKEWTRNIVKAQNEKGRLPGIVPTGTWGYDRLNGPAWDRAIVELPYQMYRFTGDTQALEICKTAWLRYLDYLETRKNADGLIGFGLGDWMQPEHASDQPDAPVLFTDSVLCMDFAKKAADFFSCLKLPEAERKAQVFFTEMRKAIRAHLMNFHTITANAACQTTQAMAIYYGVFDKQELPEAGRNLVRMIEQAGEHFNCGMLGLRVIFHVLADMGEANLAYRMITRSDFPSYGYFLKAGLTTFPEIIQRNYKSEPGSLNHHYFGDISNWFISKVAGIHVNDSMQGPHCIDIQPNFIHALDWAQAEYQAPGGTVYVKWSKTPEAKVQLDIRMPAEIIGKLILPNGYAFLDGDTTKPLQSGMYIAVSTT